MPQLPKDRITPELHRYPYFQLAPQKGKYHCYVPMDPVWYNVWAPHRVENCEQLFLENGTKPPPPLLCRIMDDYYVDSGNHRLAWWNKRGVKKVLAQVYTCKYKDVLSRALLRQETEGYVMWLYRGIERFPSYDGKWIYGISWYREFIREDQFEFLFPLWQEVTNFRNNWEWFAKQEAKKRKEKVHLDRHSFSPYHSRTLDCNYLLGEEP